MHGWKMRGEKDESEASGRFMGAGFFALARKHSSLTPAILVESCRRSCRLCRCGWATWNPTYRTTSDDPVCDNETRATANESREFLLIPSLLARFLSTSFSFLHAKFNTTGQQNRWGAAARPIHFGSFMLDHHCHCFLKRFQLQFVELWEYSSLVHPHRLRLARSTKHQPMFLLQLLLSVSLLFNYFSVPLFTSRSHREIEAARHANRECNSRRKQRK